MHPIKAHLKYLKYHKIYIGVQKISKYIYITVSELNASVIIQIIQADGMNVEDFRGEPPATHKQIYYAFLNSTPSDCFLTMYFFQFLSRD